MISLIGRRILVTRAHHQASALAGALKDRGAEVVEIPAIEIVPPDSYDALDAALRRIGEYQWLIVTSVNGANALVARLRALHQNVLAAFDMALGPSGALRIAAMGPATASALESCGMVVDLVPNEYVAERLAEALRDQVFGKKILMPRAKIARDLLPMELQKAGASVDVVEAYQTVVPTTSLAAMREIFSRPGQMPDAVTFTSSSTVTNFFRLLREAGVPGWPARMAAASIGPITSRTLLDHGIEPVVEAGEYTIPGLVDALCRWFAPGDPPREKLPHRRSPRD
jgi:uroporphyrinogen-III synthase